ncbi:MAG: type II toxin-antitoxin system VapC family toxin [Kiritimatiellae bacterium]|nr:type II toxin-antitoxin system VapC family toxin [Kiritimatiellia bacterium]
MKKILLDTNAYVRLLRGDEDVLDVLGGADTVSMSVFVLGELYAGFKGGDRESKNRAQLDEFLKRPTVRILPATQETADIFGTIKNRLKTAGTPIPINDVWLAAHAIESGSHLVTYDTHFSKVSGMLLWRE